jgi:hypothetical protein
MMVDELKGYDGLRAVNVFYTMLIGLNFLPQFLKFSLTEMVEHLSTLEREDKEKAFRLGAVFVEQKQDDLMAMLRLSRDANGVRYSQENMKNLNPKELIDIIVAVCLAVSDIDVGMISSAEKKN